MTSKHDGNNRVESFQQGVSARQRNVVYPDTLQNEVRFWRDLDTRKLNTLQKVGLALVALLFAGFGGAFVVASIEAGIVWRGLLGMAGILGPIFAAIAWGTRRALREASELKSRKRRHR